MKSIQKVAYAFMIIATVISAVAIIPLAWCIPMTVHYKKNPNDCSTGFKVCCLLFVSLISGILMLVDNNEK